MKKTPYYETFNQQEPAGTGVSTSSSVGGAASLVGAILRAVQKYCLVDKVLLPVLLPGVDPHRLPDREVLLLTLADLGLETPLLVLNGLTHLVFDPINTHGHEAPRGRGNDVDPGAGAADEAVGHGG